MNFFYSINQKYNFSLFYLFLLSMIYLINCNPIVIEEAIPSTRFYGSVEKVVVSSDNKFIALIPDSNPYKNVQEFNIKIFQSSGAHKFDLIGHENIITNIFFLKKSEILVSFDSSLILILWDLNNGNILKKKSLGLVSDLYKLSELSFAVIIKDLPKIENDLIQIKYIKMIHYDSTGNEIATILDKISRNQIIYKYKLHEENTIVVYVNPLEIKIWDQFGNLRNILKINDRDLKDICLENDYLKVIDGKNSLSYDFKGNFLAKTIDPSVQCKSNKEQSEYNCDTLDFSNKLNQEFATKIEVSSVKVCNHNLKREIEINNIQGPYSLPILFLKNGPNENLLSFEANRIVEWNSKGNHILYKDPKIERFIDFYLNDSENYFISQRADPINGNSGYVDLYKLDPKKNRSEQIFTSKEGYIKWSTEPRNENTDLYFSPFSRLLDSSLEFYRVSKGKIISILFQKENEISNLITSNLVASDFIFFANGKSISILKEGRVRLFKENAHRDEIKQMLLNLLNNDLLITLSYDNSIKVWSQNTCLGNSNCEPITELNIGESVHRIDQIKENLYIGTDEGNIYIYDKNFEMSEKFRAHSQRITSILSWNGSIVTSSLDKKIKIWDTGSFKKPKFILQSLYKENEIFYFVIKDQKPYSNYIGKLNFLSPTKFNVSNSDVKIW